MAILDRQGPPDERPQSLALRGTHDTPTLAISTTVALAKHVLWVSRCRFFESPMLAGRSPSVLDGGPGHQPSCTKVYGGNRSQRLDNAGNCLILYTGTLARPAHANIE